ncbi:unnamed protein product [Caenorhabditis angaria]|uniref:Uncharacterized protein n=1 Tax=Caenorhabditis angaria TaxID=860376 RepID=A0A9P1I8K9_9PELO|nr:unnamed protein product [Caenorhabditis angaria]
MSTSIVFSTLHFLDILIIVHSFISAYYHQSLPPPPSHRHSHSSLPHHHHHQHLLQHPPQFLRQQSLTNPQLSFSDASEQEVGQDIRRYKQLFTERATQVSLF